MLMKANPGKFQKSNLGGDFKRNKDDCQRLFYADFTRKVRIAGDSVLVKMLF
jgi:hypothetical protein